MHSAFQVSRSLTLVSPRPICGMLLRISNACLKSSRFRYVSQCAGNGFTLRKVARCTKIIQASEGEEAKYVINIKQIAKFVVGLGDKVAPTDVEEGMRVG